MKILAVCFMLLGLIAFWSIRSDRDPYDAARAESLTLNYGIFRNAVFDYAHRVKTEGIVTADNPALELPDGWTGLRAWRGVIQRQDAQLYCYVFGPARPEEIVAVQKAFRNSRAVGWNDNGIFIRNGDPMPLPTMIPDGSVVSVIRLD